MEKNENNSKKLTKEIVDILNDDQLLCTALENYNTQFGKNPPKILEITFENANLQVTSKRFAFFFSDVLINISGTVYRDRDGSVIRVSRKVGHKFDYGDFSIRESNQIHRAYKRRLKRETNVSMLENELMQKRMRKRIVDESLTILSMREKDETNDA
jgi:hypothetical protein